jgi:hypothetical protein
MAEKALEMEEAADSGRMGRDERVAVLLETERTTASWMEWM